MLNRVCAGNLCRPVGEPPWRGQESERSSIPLFAEQAVDAPRQLSLSGASSSKPVVGMSDDHFRDRGASAALPDDLKAQYDRLPLRNVRSNQYVILKGACR